MTREEQKQIADFVRSYIAEIITESGIDKNAHTNETLRKVADGIEKMDTEPCEDAISREEALKCFTWTNDKADAWNGIKNLPSVTPKQKMGRWIKSNDIDFYKCSECGCHWGKGMVENCNMEFCPNCGAKMESEDA